MTWMDAVGIKGAVDYQPVFIIGAGRSGTNILRDSITAFNGLETWPCDEINLIWRHGNLGQASDVFTPAQARPEVARYLRRFFDKFARTRKADYVIEKTCANTLRIPFIEHVFPEARYIYIVRDGRDVVASAARRWVAPVEPRYLLKKLPYVPVGDFPHYLWRFIVNRVHQIRQRDGRQASWGPRFEGMEIAAREKSLDHVCALQWAASVEASEQAFLGFSPEKIFRLKYENFVTRPADTVQEILAWLGADSPDSEALASITGNISATSVGNWRRAGLDGDTLAALGPMLRQLSYCVDQDAVSASE